MSSMCSQERYSLDSITEAIEEFDIAKVVKGLTREKGELKDT